MKINWGTGIVIAIILFIAFIMSMVYQMSTDKKYDHDLVTEEYYKEELKFQQSINATKNAKSLTEKITISRVTEGLKVTFPTEFEPKKIKGSVILYRPSNAKLDLRIPIDIETNTLIIPSKNLIEGRWDISVQFNYKNKTYLHKDSLKY